MAVEPRDLRRIWGCHGYRVRERHDTLVDCAHQQDVGWSEKASDRARPFRTYYGPTMNAFEAAEANGRGADLQNELEVLFDGQNVNPSKDATSIRATFLRVTVAL